MLKRLREAAGLDVYKVAEHIGYDRTALGRWEQGINVPKIPTIRALAELYGASSVELSKLTTYATQAKRRGVYEHANLPIEVRMLYEAEPVADVIQSLELDYLPGLVQTPEYLRATQAVQIPHPTEVDTAVQDLRRQRQEAVFDNRSPRVELVFGQSALLYLDSMPEIKSGQVARLRELAALDTVDIRVLTGLHAAMVGAFTIIEPDSGNEAASFVFLESADGCRYLEDRDVVSRYRQTFRLCQKQASPLEEYLR
ncbi:helix-turn-helix transcriptional regulator [Stackebrandtia endophytica]|nr:helix-turn-helix transcriptional regulator [Stackebrandtia endophytica]